MRSIVKGGVLILSFLLFSCGEKKEKESEGFSLDRQKTQTEQTEATTTDSGVKASERVTLDDKGVGPITTVSLGDEVNQEMAAEGKAVYDQMCLACHRIGKRFIGPPPNGILERRSPEWVMNMILNPDVMVQQNPLAKDLLVEFNGSPMANQGLTEAQARAVLEYFRTLEK